MRITSLTLAFILIVVAVCLESFVVSAQTSTDAVLVAIDGYMSTIDQPTKEYVVDEGLKLAESRGVPLIVVINTYGGYEDAMLDIVNAFLNAKVPVLGFIKERALSAGSIIAISTHILAITPHGIIGAAQPIMYNPVTGQVQFINESKIVNPILARIKTCAEARHRNVTAASMFVTENLVLTGKEAVEMHVVDLVATSVEDMIDKINGWTITVGGMNYTINIHRYEVLNPSVRALVYAFLRDPTVNSIFWFIGFFGTFAALLSGRIDILPFTIVMLLLGLIGSGMNINIIALALLALGSIMLAIELFVTPGFGILGVSGIIALVFGMLMTPFAGGAEIYTSSAVLETIRNTLLIVGGGIGGFLGFVLYKAIESRRKRRAIGFSPERGAMVGRAVDRIEPGKRGFVIIEGEYWEAISDEVIEPGEEVEVIERQGLILKVKKRRSATS